jgi:MFS family permease
MKLNASFLLTTEHRITFFLCIIVMGATMSSSLIAPSIVKLQQDFKCTREVATLTLSLYDAASLHSTFLVLCMLIFAGRVGLGWATGPLIFSPMSEIYGRAIVYRTTWIAFVAFSFGCTQPKNITTLILCRLFSGVFGGVVIALAPASAYDMYSSKRDPRSSQKLALWLTALK